MSFLRRLAVGLAHLGLGLSLLVVAVSATLFATFLNPNYLKTTLNGSGFYKNIVNSGLNLAAANDKSPNSELTAANVTQLKPTIEGTLTPALLQTNLEQVIDGFGDWLTGKSPLPDFALDTATLKNNLVTQLAGYFEQRLAGLPACPKNNDITGYDLITTTCRPPVTLTAADYRKTAATFVDQIPLLDKNKITFNDFVSTAKAQNAAWHRIPQAYGISQMVPYIFGFLALISIAIIVGLSKDRARGCRIVGHTFIGLAVTLLLFGIVLVLVVDKNLINQISATTVEQTDFINSVVKPILHSIASTVGSWLLYFGVGYAVLGAASYFVAHWLKRRQKRALEVPDEHIPTPPSDSPFSQPAAQPEPVLPPEVIPVENTNLPYKLPPTGPPPTGQPANRPPRPKPPLVQ